MSNIETGGPAFPSTNQVRIGDMSTSGHAGPDLRDYFAAKAMQAHITAHWDSFVRSCNSQVTANQLVSECSYEMADSMLEARK